MHVRIECNPFTESLYHTLTRTSEKQTPILINERNYALGSEMNGHPLSHNHLNLLDENTHRKYCGHTVYSVQINRKINISLSPSHDDDDDNDCTSPVVNLHRCAAVLLLRARRWPLC